MKKWIDTNNITLAMLDAFCEQCPSINDLNSREVNAGLIAFLEAAPDAARSVRADTLDLCEHIMKGDLSQIGVMARSIRKRLI